MKKYGVSIFCFILAFILTGCTNPLEKFGKKENTVVCSATSETEEATTVTTYTMMLDESDMCSNVRLEAIGTLKNGQSAEEFVKDLLAQAERENDLEEVEGITAKNDKVYREMENDDCGTYSKTQFIQEMTEEGLTCK